MHRALMNGKRRLPQMLQAVHECTLQKHNRVAKLLWTFLEGSGTRTTSRTPTNLGASFGGKQWRSTELTLKSSGASRNRPRLC
jgi:hypothetical protein